VDSLNIDSESPVAIEFDIPNRLKSSVYQFNINSEQDFLNSSIGLEVELTLAPEAQVENNALSGLLNATGDINVALTEHSNNFRTKLDWVSVLTREEGVKKVKWEHVKVFRFSDELIQSQ